jgi:WS/DGAT/MGAT family acyltransferase
MRQLGGLDNLMIQGEPPGIPLHICALMLYETHGRRGADRVMTALQENFEAISHDLFPILRCRVDEVALQLDKAYWVQDSHFDQACHLTRVALPKPRDWDALYRLFGQFHAQPLDRARPLWQVMLVEDLDALEGIPHGSTAVFFKIHHAAMDGKSAIRLASSLHGLDPAPGSPLLADSMERGAATEADFRAPPWWLKYGLAWWHGIERPVELLVTLLKLLPRLLQADDPGAGGEKQGVPATRFNRPLAADRVVGHARMAMADLRRIEKAHDCTINDIALCAVGGALRDYLAAGDELPAEDLQALMPIDLRRREKDGSMGNRVSAARVCLYTHIDDPLERLQAISRHAARSKSARSKGASRSALALVDEIHPAIILVLGNWLYESGRLEQLPRLVNTVITNVPGMPDDLYLGGARMIDYLGFGPLAPGVGLFHTVSSTREHVNISFVSTQECLADGRAYGEALQRSCAAVTASLLADAR